ncbi:unnamed protein product [Bursaphelenchus xylophilus]|uniref:(pine wood nematode) hypothetical protein n=1 Tax=Bursaphelenchus xylophilus TaxID=6326 RepID=A0A1I7RH90_BURXY|nr:unnamed protein product [Bursaphelenchus xylophilus]CAG9115926.1 unnamed protein product [Bursaphelenchus xylophilus]
MPSNQFKLFPVRLAEFYNLNITDHDYELDDTVQGVSLAAFLPILVIFIVAITLFVFIKCKKWRRNRDNFKKLRKVYDALEILDLLHENGNPDPLLLSQIDKALVGENYEAGRDLVNRDNMIKYEYSVRRPSTLPILNKSVGT